jgi:hypothetical protein
MGGFRCSLPGSKPDLYRPLTYADPVSPYPHWQRMIYRLPRPVTREDVAAFVRNQYFAKIFEEANLRSNHRLPFAASRLSREALFVTLVRYLTRSPGLGATKSSF